MKTEAIYRKSVGRVSAVVIAALCLLGSLAAQAALVVDRGLPNANLNNAAGSDRSNVAWDFVGNYISGDSFTLSALDPAYSAWEIERITTWVVAGDHGTDFQLSDRFDHISLFLGNNPDIGGSLSRVATGTFSGGVINNPNIVISKVDYPGNSGVGYQVGNGAMRQIWQIDFLDLDLLVAPGEVLFAVDGSNDTSTEYWYAHASNAALSGTDQDGADDTMYWFAGNASDAAVTVEGTWSSEGNGWDKASDHNIRVWAAQVPEPATWLLMLAGSLAVAGMRRSRSR